MGVIELGFIVLCFSQSCFCLVYRRHLSERIVTTSKGRVRGVVVEFPNPTLRPVEAYLGIQYGTIQGKKYRFGPSQDPEENWTVVRTQTNHGPVCPQKKMDLEKLSRELPAHTVENYRRILQMMTKQDEDCLNLNLYVPIQGKYTISCISTHPYRASTQYTVYLRTLYNTLYIYVPMQG